MERRKATVTIEVEYNWFAPGEKVKFTPAYRRDLVALDRLAASIEITGISPAYNTAGLRDGALLTIKETVEDESPELTRVVLAEYPKLKVFADKLMPADMSDQEWEQLREERQKAGYCA